jgi:hypothetical protein
MTMGAALEEEPPEKPLLMAVEIQGTRHIKTLRALYQGPMVTIAGDEVISRMMVQNVCHPGLSHVYGEFFSDAGGSRVYVREEPQLVGVPAQ